MDHRNAFKTVILFNAIPVDRLKVNRRSAQLALELVEDDWNLVIYPEGGRTPDGRLQEFKGGAAYLAERSKATVIPTYIHESGWLKAKKYAKAPLYRDAPNERRHHVIIAFGEPLRCDVGENMRHFGVRIEQAVQELGREVSSDPTYGRPLEEP
jgi:1-acyl-sn-glycerol-3-phosphate acyltransferase